MGLSESATEKQVRALAKAGYPATELKGLTVGQASNLLHYVSQNNWRRPTAAQVDAIAAGELNADADASKRGLPMARIPSTEEVDELTKEMPAARAYAFEEALCDLKAAIDNGKAAVLEQGRALLLLKEACSHGQWGESLRIIELPRPTAHRQIQIAKAHAAVDPIMREILKSRGVKFDSSMSGKDVRLALRAAEVAHKAEREVEKNPDLFQDGTNTPKSDDPFTVLASEFRQKRQVDSNVKARVGAFLDQELQPKVPPAQNAKSTSKPSAPCVTSRE